MKNKETEKKLTPSQVRALRRQEAIIRRAKINYQRKLVKFCGGNLGGWIV